MRVCIIVLDSVGIGALPDAADFGDAGAHTLGNIYKKRGKLALPHLYAMGLAHIEDARLPMACPTSPAAAYGRMATRTRAKDTTSGHWEIAGLSMETPFATFTHFPETLLAAWLERAGREAKWLGNMPASGTQIMDALGEAHMKTAAPIVYTSADSVFQVAAHEETIPLDELYRLCAIAREMLVGDNFVGRVIARPFLGKPGQFKRTENRRDYAVPPVGETLLDALEKHGQKTLGIGKIEDIFCNRGVGYVNHTTNNPDGIAATIEALANTATDATLIFTNLVDFDMHYGHRNDTEGYARALEYFDTRLPEIKAALQEDDLLIITADHGCDPTTPGTDHTREYVPLLVYRQGIRPVALGTRTSLADIAATIYEGLGHGRWREGESFWRLI
ncbi:MAG: phosphopentomutase [Defluviitaleaceae bacterium]|nr:phosphopentomutase [Defluviitaleaceae bacterium]MCL2240831.1 phosphopentomutase [Defluviitaleaceae bacterium]